MKIIVFGLAFVSQAAAVLGQEAAQTCPDRSRSADITAGTHNSGTTQCSPTVTVSIAGISVSSPTSCTTGYSEYLGTVYKCDVVCPGWKCGPSFKVPLHVYYGGKCPSIDITISGMSWANWAEVPKAIVKQFKCIEPKKRETFDWSAGKPTSCATGTASKDYSQGQTFRAPDGSYFSLWTGEPSLPAPIPVENPFFSDYERAQTGIGDALPGLLKQAVTHLGELSNASVSGTVTVRRFMPGASDADYVDSISFTGIMASDGRFDLETLSVADLEGREVVHEQRHTFDGETYRQFSFESEFGNVYPTSYANFGRSLTYIRSVAGPLTQWMHNPYDVPQFVDDRANDETDPAEGRVLRVLEAHGTDSEYRFDLDNEMATIVSTRDLDRDGAVVYETLCSELADLGGGVMRPLVVQTVRTLSDGERIETTLTVRDPKALAADASPSGEWSSDHEWQVWGSR